METCWIKDLKKKKWIHPELSRKYGIRPQMSGQGRLYGFGFFFSPRINESTWLGREWVWDKEE